jgi:raffinose/stachyose/melibiose transport system substrate-binding protein
MKRVVVLLLATVVALSTFAGGSKETAAEGKKKVVWWTSATEDEYRPTINRLFVEGFNAANPDIELDLVYMEDYYRTTQTAVQAGAGPDVIQLGGPGYALEYWSAQQIIDLSDYGSLYGWEEKLLPWAYESGRGKDGSLISMPVHYETIVMFYNKTKMDELALKPPTNRAELELVLSKAKENDLMGFAHYFARNRWHFPSMWGGYAGHDLFRLASIQEMRWDHPLFVEAMRLWNDQIQKGWWGNDLETYYSLAYADCNSALGEGDALLMINGTWVFRNLIQIEEESGMEFDWAPIPTLREGVEQVYELSVGESVCINAKAAYPAETAKAIDWLYSDRKRAAELAEANRFSNWFVPIRYENGDFSPNVDPRITRWITEFGKATEQGKYGYPIWGYWPPQAKTWAEKEIARLHNGEWTAEQFMKNFQTEYAARYAESDLPVPPEPNLSSPR